MDTGGLTCSGSSACYRCLLRYGNQHYHGLLDWPLGLQYLRALVDPNFRCGLDGDFSAPGLQGWPDLAKRFAQEMVDRFRGEGPRPLAGGLLHAFRLEKSGGKKTRWVVVAHPLWDWNPHEASPDDTLLQKAEAELSNEGAFDCWDTFNLSRRRVQVKEWIQKSG